MLENVFEKVPRGRALNGAREISEFLWGDSSRWRSVYLLDGQELGISMLAGQLTGYSGWITAALAGHVRRRQPPRKCRPRLVEKGRVKQEKAAGAAVTHGPK
jgi:hypothetical protein